MNTDGPAVILTGGVSLCRRVPRAKPGSGYVRADLRPVGHDDTEREPDSPRRVPSDDVAHEMNAQVDPAEPDEQNEAFKERNRRPAWKMGRGDTGEQVSQKAVSDQGTHHVAARKTPARPGNPRL